MRSLTLRAHPDDDLLHPMHAFVADHDGFERSELLNWSRATDGTSAMVFRVLGDDPEAYAAALDRTEQVLDYRLGDARPGRFYLYVRDRQTPADRQLTAPVADTTLVVVPPVVHAADRTIRFTLVGPDEELQRTVERLPDEAPVDVVRLTGFDPGAFDAGADLTPRQREALEAAYDAGYYAAERTGTVADVAAELDCAPGTAAEHLRKAEARVIGRALGRE